MLQLRRKVEISSELWLVTSEETGITSEETKPPDTFSTQKEIKVNEIKVNQKGMAPAAPTDPAAKSKKFIQPTVQEVEKYFLLIIGNPNNPGYWPADKCRNEAAVYIDHYIANGWVQKQGKPIKNWQAACRNWIRNALKGTFEKDAQVFNRESVPRPKEVVETRNNTQLEINYLFERYLEDQITVISVTPMHYNYLKNSGHLLFSDQEKESMRKLSVDYLAANNLPGDEENILRFMKKFAVLEYFKKLKDKSLAPA
jgi:hypothetical protein